VFETDLLVLDELGAIKPTEWVWNTVSLILNSRYNNQLATLITTNLADADERDNAGTDKASSREAARYAASRPTLGDRITNPMRSRLHEMCKVVTLDGVEDWRQLNRDEKTQRLIAQLR
jgi:DNA replication protein DnaC